jgi:hypothetical protein
MRLQGLIALGLLLGFAAQAAAYRSGAPAGHTGGFGEAHCGACHFAAPQPEGAARATVQAPARFEPGAAYEITVEVAHPDLATAGFQLTARFAHGDRAGRQAGRLEPLDDRVQISTGPDDVVYAGQTETGAVPAEPGAGRWTLRWTAPDSDGPVLFNLAANAANGDDSEFGDHILLAEHRATPAPASPGR